MSTIQGQLAHLAQAYFHQDYDLEFATPNDVIEAYKRDEGQAAVAELVAQIGSILSSPMSDSDVGNVWIRQLGAAYDPIRDGKGYREWLGLVRQQLQGA